MDFVTPRGDAADTHPEYCRAVESYLCRKNDGHLIRIVGPAFERVCDWADRGVPLKVVFRGIDRYFERYYAKGPRRRPVRIEFCEADVLDVFDEWRRAVGVLVARERPDSGDGDAYDRAAVRPHARRSLAAHLERVAARLVALGADEPMPLPGDVLQHAIEEVTGLQSDARVLRGDARQAAIDRLAVLDAALVEAAREHLDRAALEDIGNEATRELEPFRARMSEEAHAAAVAACAIRIIRERARLPTVTFEG